jgi:hypothetical protein
MGSRYMEAAPPSARIIEPSPVQDTFVTDILPVEHCGDYVRLTHVLERPDYERDGEIVRTIVSRVVYPAKGFARALRKVFGTMRCPHCGNAFNAEMLSAGGNGDRQRPPSA